MEADYTWPSIFFSYLLFFILFAGTGYFLLRTRKDGYWGASSEEPKFRMLQDDEPLAGRQGASGAGDNWKGNVTRHG